ncbi:zinc finger, CCHC-type containing protein [Tanacetum coccineum]
MNLDARISLVPPHVEVQGRYGQNLDTQEGFGAGPELTTADAELNTASTAIPQRHADTTADDLTIAETLMEIRKRAAKAKGKAKMDETESPRKMKLREVAADEDFVQQLQAGEKCSEEDLPMKLVELVNRRKKFFAQQRAEAKRKKPMTHAQQKEYMSNYINNQEGGYSIKQLKTLSFEQVKEIFETTMRKVQSFVPMGSELEVQRLKRAGQEVLEEPVKRQKIGEASGSGEESVEKEKELSEEELQKLLVIVLVEEVYVEALQVKYSIIDWEVYFEDTRRRGSVQQSLQMWVELKRLFELDNDDALWKLQRMGYQINASMNVHDSAILEDSLPPKEKDPGSELTPTKLIIELADRTIKHPKGIAENVLLGIDKFVFPIDFVVLDIPEDIKVPLILGRPFLSTAHAKIDVFKRKINLKVGDDKIVFKSDKPTSNIIKRVYALGLRERMELDLESRLMREALILNRSPVSLIFSKVMVIIYSRALYRKS